MRFSLLLVCAAACGSVKQQPGNDSFTCPANEFISCDGNMATSCNAAGDGTSTVDCGGAGCNADAKRCNMCSPNTVSCGASTVDHCGPDGLPTSQDTCTAGCIDMPMPHCAYLEPRYLPDVCDMPATMADFTVTTTATFDTGLDNNCNGGIVTQQGGPTICVVRFGTINVKPGATANIVGTRALALVADTAINIDGTLDVSAHQSVSGPGAGAVSGGAASGATGGGGAGFRTAGAAGGNAAADGGGAAGGAAGTDPSLLTIMVGGTHPAAGGILQAGAGGAGGAATLIACRGTVTVSATGTIAAGGGGGGAGADILGGAQEQFVAGAGGGAGGNVVLQGLAISVTGQVFANGGGGGAGSDTNDQAGLRGADGQHSTQPAPGGGVTAGEGAGGSGGAIGALPTVGHHPQAGSAGGGGGSLGFFQSYTPQNVQPTLTPSAASPGFQANKTIQLR